jgi:hypothetical protein
VTLSPPVRRTLCDGGWGAKHRRVFSTLSFGERMGHGAGYRSTGGHGLGGARRHCFERRAPLPSAAAERALAVRAPLFANRRPARVFFWQQWGELEGSTQGGSVTPFCLPIG